MSRSKRNFQKYRLIADIGHGGMADVYLAVASGPAGFNKLLVIKQIRVELADDPSFVSMFLDEARLAARVNHPNVVQTVEVGEEGGCYYLAMEYLDGQPLSRLQHRAAGQFPLAYRVRILADTLVGLHHAHELRNYDGTPLGVVHRDVSPHNVFVTYDGQVKVVDFGVAKAATSSGHTRTGMLKGKLSYMAPEQAGGERVDRRADLFAVGVMLWEAITGRRMWAGMPSDIAVVHRLVTGEIPPLPPPTDAHEAELKGICERALAFRMEDRYATAAEMADDLETYLERLPVRSSNRELGALVAELFAADRASIQATINEQLAALEMAHSGSFPALPVLGEPSSMRQPAASAPTVVEPVSELTPRSASSLTTHGASASLPPPKEDEGRGGRAVKPWVLASGVAALVVGALVVGRGLSPAAPAAPGVEAPAVKQVEIRVAVAPSSARLFFDDEPLPGNPHTLRMPADGRTHLIRAEADGHLPRVRQLVVDKDFSIEFALERASAPAVASVATPATAAVTPPAGNGPRGAAPAATEGPTRKPTKGRRNVDPDNPYAQ